MLLKAQTREVVGKKVKTLRAQKLVPASIYGPNTETKNIVVADKEFRQLFKEVGYSKLFDLEVEGTPAIKALLKEIQVDKLKNQLIHASIYAVDMKKPVTTIIPLRFEGVSLAVKNNLGLIVTSMSNLTVSCLPEKLPNEYIIDISKLNNVGDSIFVKDIDLGEGVTLVGTNKEAVVASIASPQKSIEEETPKTETEAAAAETTEAAPAEGEAAK